MNLPEFGVRRPVVANLVMFALVGAGLVFGLSLRREFFPAVNPTMVVVTAPYPGAAPEEVESALAVKIEDALAELDGVKEISSTASEGFAAVQVEFEDGTDIERAVAEVKREIDALQDLPAGAERITIDELEPNLPAISVSLRGGADERAMKDFILGVRSDLETLPGMGDVVLGGTRRDELRVETHPEALVKHGLSLVDVSDRIGAAMAELPGGSVRGSASTVAIRTVGVAERAEEVRRIVVKAGAGGQVLRVGDVATVTPGFEDTDLRVRLNGEPAVSLTVFKTGEDDIVTIAEMVKAYVAGRNGEPIEATTGEWLASRLRRPDAEGAVSARVAAWELGHARWLQGPPPGTLQTTTDLARFVVGRLDLLTRNALWGGVLVFLVLVLLLNWRVAFWVTAGMIVSLLGTLAFMSFVGVTLNLLTMFGLIIVVGILVDDAIVVAENIATRHEAGDPPKVAAVRGATPVMWPVVATVLTTIVAFLPLGLIQGSLGDFLVWLPIVVACALSISLIECLLILPSHMAHTLRAHDRQAERPGVLAPLWRAEARMDRARERLFERALIPRFTALLALAIRWPYITASIALAVLIVSVGMVAGGRVGFILFESDDAETVNITLQMPVGTPAARTDEVLARFERAALAQPEVSSAFAQSGAISSMDGEDLGSSAGHLGQIVLELTPAEDRNALNQRTSEELIEAIRAEVGPVAGVKSLRMEGVGAGPGGPSLSFTFVGADGARVEEAAERLKAFLAEFPAVYGVADDADRGQRELRFTLREGASELGFTQASLGRQVQGAVFGLEAYTFAGDREDVDVRVMMPESVRRQLGALERMFVFSPDGTPVPLGEVARIDEARTNATIRRLDRQRSITVTADVDRAQANPDELASAEVQPFLKQLQAEMPGVRAVERGRQKDFTESMSSLPVGMLIASGLIYIILAWLFGSFLQPLVVMAAIPFAVIGMVWGHSLLGYSMTFLSLIGFVALAGVVVNDSLILMEFFNTARSRGVSVREGVVEAGRARFRAIILTTCTTVAGLMPLLLERSFQAKFLIPMAITIACGLISATVLILILLPCLLVIADDLVHGLRVLWTGNPELPRRNPRAPDHELDALHEPA